MKQSVKQRGSAAIIAAAVIVVLAIIGGGVYIATDGFGNNTNNAETATTESNSQTDQIDQTEQSEVSLLEEAFLGNGTVKCTFKEAEASGTAYIAGENKFRVDYSSPDGNGHMVAKEDTFYLWSEAEKEGIKISTATMQENKTIANEVENYSPENLKENYNDETTDCVATKFDNKLLNLPSDVEFKSFEEMMQGSFN